MVQGAHVVGGLHRGDAMFTSAQPAPATVWVVRDSQPPGAG